MSVTTGLVYPHLLKSRMCVLSSLTIAFVVTIIAHVLWARNGRLGGITEHIFPTHEAGVWYADISIAGWMHVGVMALLLTVLMMYAVSTLPVKVVITVSLLLTIHVFLANLQPGWYCTGKLWTWRNFVIPIVAGGVIWVMAVLKIQRAGDPF